MNNQQLHIICGNRSERIPKLLKELSDQNITNYELWEGLYLPSIKESINRSHKQIVQFAKLAEFDEVAIAEDDVRFTNPKGWQYFIEHKPTDFDLYLGGLFLGVPDNDNVVESFTGMTMYIISQRFYDTFLSVENDAHIDHSLKGLGRYIVSNPLVVTQWNGVSGNTGKFEDYEALQGGRQFL